MSTNNTTKIFVNLPVKDLPKAKEFFGKLGFNFNAQFSDDAGACMVVSEHAYVMLLTHLIWPLADTRVTPLIAFADRRHSVHVQQADSACADLITPLCRLPRPAETGERNGQCGRQLGVGHRRVEWIRDRVCNAPG